MGWNASDAVVVAEEAAVALMDDDGNAEAFCCEANLQFSPDSVFSKQAWIFVKLSACVPAQSKFPALTIIDITERQHGFEDIPIVGHEFNHRLSELFASIRIMLELSS
ncbi:hypothetical protein DL768_010162 [Monosporascus sp. mg162]|nr:hypothetical protein DL768_010162 [Monosporascus sp. mg162]